jgi:hypothetical protein
LALSLPAGAAELPGITGNWGNESGCAMGRGGVRENEEMLLLTPTEVQTYATICSFLSVQTDGSETMIPTVVCGHEGDDLITAGMMIIRRRAEKPDALLITDADGNEWGEVRPCK